VADQDPRAITAWLRGHIAQNSGRPLGRGYQAYVRLFDSPFGRLVVKYPHRKGPLGLLTKKSIARELRAYRRLAGVPGVPRMIGLVDDELLVLEHIPGASLREHDQRFEDREQFFARLLETLERMHAAGVAHGDLKRKANTLVGPGERPYIVDFGIACIRQTDGGLLNRLWFDWLRQMDYNAWTKLKYGRNPTGLSPEDEARYKPLLVERVARWIRIPWQKITLRRLRQRWKKASFRKPS
jgi:predicted Ser/Thr protein kinase